MTTIAKTKDTVEQAEQQARRHELLANVYRLVSRRNREMDSPSSTWKSPTRPDCDQKNKY